MGTEIGGLMTLNGVMAVIFCDFTELDSFKVNYVTVVDVRPCRLRLKRRPKNIAFGNI